MSHYHSGIGLYPFQAEDIARGYLMPSGVVAWDTGTGKGHFAMALSALLFEDDLIDLVLLVAEKNKIADDEWVGDFRTFTDLRVHRYHGTGRAKRLAREPVPPQVLVTTYETAKADLVRMTPQPNRRTRTLSLGPLGEVIGDRRVLVIYDECTKIKNRSSDTYKAHHWYLNRHLRVHRPETRAFGLTATPLEVGWEDAYNQMRLLWPPSMPLVKDFESRYVRSRDPYGRPTYHRDRMEEFAALFQAYTLRRRKTDPDLIEQFPKMVEESHHLSMGDAQRRFYEDVEEICFPEDGEPEPGMQMLMRQIAGHPSSILHGQGLLARVLVDELGADYISSIPSVKTEYLPEYLTPLVLGQQAKVVVFTFFGPSMIPLLSAALRAHRMRVFVRHGGLTAHEMERARREFRAYDGPAVLLTSDAGSRGINLPEATYLVEYESALTYANRTQRINRINRIDSTAPSTHAMTFILDGTVEEALAMNMSERNRQSDILLGDTDAGEHFLSADQRREALRIARTRRGRGRAA